LSGVQISNTICSQGEHHAHTLACTLEREVFSWGDGYKGKLGHGNQDVPIIIDNVSFCCHVVVSTAQPSQTKVICLLGDVAAMAFWATLRSKATDISSEVIFLVSWKAFFQKSGKVVAISCSYYHSGVLCSGDS